jgi:hypothetical protein
LSSYRIFETDEFLKKLRKLTPRDKAFVQGILGYFIHWSKKKKLYICLPWIIERMLIVRRKSEGIQRLKLFFLLLD